jgi:transcriptional regulator with XRE-family HTH domain
LSIGDRIRKKRKENNLTQKELASRVNVSAQVISNWERGYTDPDHDDVSRLADALNCSTEYLHGRSNKETPASSDLPKLTAKEERDIAIQLEKMLSDLDNKNAVSFYGEPMDEETKEAMRISLESSLRLAKQLAKQKFTPKKYRK